MKSAGVVYMLTGSKHGVQLAVAVQALRRVYDGPVALIAGNEAGKEICDKISEDHRSGEVIVSEWAAPVGGGKGLQHCNKSRITELMPFDEAVFLDCDTLVVNDFSELFPRPGTEEVVLSQFANWWSDERKIKNRTEGYREILPAEVARAQASHYPAINTGTFGITKASTAYVEKWKRGCDGRPHFMCDEIIAQLIFMDFPHRVLDERWNCSPIFSHPRFGPPKDADVRIWHGHGWKFITRQHGWRIWKPYLDTALRTKFAHVDEWIDVDRKLVKVLANGGPERRS